MSTVGTADVHSSCGVYVDSDDPAALTVYRLYPDMFAFTRQVQIACDTAKGAVARLAEIEIESLGLDPDRVARVRASRAAGDLATACGLVDQSMVSLFAAAGTPEQCLRSLTRQTRPAATALS